MRCLVALIMILSLAGLQGCDGVFVGFVSNPSTATGTISIVHLTSTSNGTQITVVTLLSNFVSQEMSFCGDEVGHFPVGSTVKVSFTPGTPCDSFIAILVVF